MHVLMDIKWIEDDKKHWIPTQIAAVRINHQCMVLDRFNTLIAPFDIEKTDWNNVAYASIPAEEYKASPLPPVAFRSLDEWLRSDDQLCWWYKSGKRVFDSLYRIFLRKYLLQHGFVITDRIHEYLRCKTDIKGNPFELSEAMGIPQTIKPYDACNDVETIRRLLLGIRFPMKQLTNKSCTSDFKSFHLVLDFLYGCSCSHYIKHLILNQCYSLNDFRPHQQQYSTHSLILTLDNSCSEFLFRFSLFFPVHPQFPSAIPACSQFLSDSIRFSQFISVHPQFPHRFSLVSTEFL